MPPPSKKAKTGNKPLEKVIDLKAIISDLETKLKTLQNNYEKCQIKLEKALEENEELKRQILLKAGIGRVNKGDKRSSSFPRRSPRRPPTPEHSKGVILSDNENSNGEDQDFQVEEGQSPLDIKQENIFNDEADEDNRSEGYDFVPLTPPSPDSTNGVGGSDSSSDADEKKQLPDRTRNLKRSIKKSPRNKGKVKVKIERTKKKSKRKSLKEKTLEKLTPSGLEVDIVNFMDDIISTKRQHTRPGDHEDISEFDTNGLDQFHVALGKTLDSCLRHEIKIKKLAPTPIVSGVRNRVNVIKYFNAVPAPNPYIEGNLKPKRVKKLKRKPIGLDDLPPEGKPPSNTKRVRVNYSDGLPRQFTPKLCSTYIPDEQHHICEFCGTTCDSLTQFKRHMITHGAPTHPCPVCEKLFKRKDDVQKHVQSVHEKLYRFQCPMCPKQFTDSSGFRRHERVHLNIKPHLCSICGRRFAELKNLRMHSESQHSGKEQPHRVKKNFAE